MRKAVENGFPCEGRVITGLKAGVNEMGFRLKAWRLPLTPAFKPVPAYPESAKPF
jgi:hypothetical protein